VSDDRQPASVNLGAVAEPGKTEAASLVSVSNPVSR
jgi:hypothetical protein